MQRLKDIFQLLGLAEVETLIASGNVIFRSPAKSSAALEAKIEQRLQRELGYEVKTFLRTDLENAIAATRAPFKELAADTPSTLYVGFLKSPPERAAETRLRDAQTAVDELQIAGRELYWRCRGGSSESALSGAKLEKVLGMPTTLRNINTVQRLAAKYGPVPS